MSTGTKRRSSGCGVTPSQVVATLADAAANPDFVALAAPTSPGTLANSAVHRPEP